MNYTELKNYLEGKTSGAESEMIRNWLKNNGNDAESRKILGEIWTNSSIRLTGTKPDFDKMLDLVHHRINSENSHLHVQKTNPRSGVSRLYHIFSRIAAILILPILLLSLYLYYNPNKITNELATVSVREIYTKPGTRTKIELPDGTQVWLNDGTTIRYPEKFTGINREVYIDGEAYFEVESDLQNPFVVNNPMMTTVVTGTHFNLNAYSADKYFEATLLQGKVSLKKNNQTFEMKPGEQVQFDAQNEKIVQKNIATENATAWIDGKLIFTDEKLGIAIKKLGRWYNVEIILADPALNGYLLTGTFRDEKLDQTLRLISLALPVKFEFKKEKDPSKIQRTIFMKKK
ncbi:MAG: FecR domain-containing protein [Bacteroidota bacterium]|nr:FecR domain-containing protein [Bacteroidota bacterium]